MWSKKVVAGFFCWSNSLWDLNRNRSKDGDFFSSASTHPIFCCCWRFWETRKSEVRERMRGGSSSFVLVSINCLLTSLLTRTHVHTHTHTHTHALTHTHSHALTHTHSHALTRTRLSVVALQHLFTRMKGKKAVGKKTIALSKGHLFRHNRWSML